MQVTIPLAPEQASTFAGEVDALYFYLVGIAVFFSTLIAVLIFYFAVKYRRRSPDEVPRPIAGSVKLETAWSAIPFLIMMTLFAWGVSVYFKETRPPDNALDVFVVGKQWMWKFQHSGGQREINELHVPLGRKIKLTMTTEDVIHAFYVPAFRLQFDVVPGRYTYAWFEATQTGRFHLFCAEYCGLNHAGMGGYVVVQQPEEYEAWLNSRATDSPASQGEKLFASLGCATCHLLDRPGRCPNLRGLYGKPVQLDTGETVMADDAYLRESILNSQAKIVAGYQRPSIMPLFQGQISEDQTLQLMAYIKSLGTMPEGGGATIGGGTAVETGMAPGGAGQQVSTGRENLKALQSNPIRQPVQGGAQGSAPVNLASPGNQGTNAPGGPAGTSRPAHPNQ